MQTLNHAVFEENPIPAEILPLVRGDRVKRLGGLLTYEVGYVDHETGLVDCRWRLPDAIGPLMKGDDGIRWLIEVWPLAQLRRVEP